jgi:hypothetical protein
MKFFRRANWSAVEASAAILGVLVAAGALWAATFQLNEVKNALRSAGSQAVFSQQLEVNKLFLGEEGEKYIPYFFDDVKVPPEDKPKAALIAGSILDFFSNLEDQQDAGSFEIDSGWEVYINDSFLKSPILCDTLEKNLDAYGGKNGLIPMYAEDPCNDK